MPGRIKKSTFSSIAIAVLLFGWLTGTAIGTPDTGAAERPEFLRGMTVSCPGYGRIWGSPEMAHALDELGELGVRWAAIHPYAGVGRDGSIRFTPAAETGYLERSVEIAKDAGIKLFWKPHLAYWGSFEWRGDIDFGDDAGRWRRFFDGYRAFIVDQARFAETHRLPLLAVGLEYAKTLGHEDEWRRILADVRRVYSGRITYSANWDRIDEVPFWDAVDMIGVQAYFPLSYEPSPDRRAIEQGWDEHLDRLRKLSERYRKPVVFAEIGYDFSADAASEPWKSSRRNNADTRALRRRLMEVALERIEREPFIAGMFWWKWLPGSRERGDFSMRHPEARQILQSAWGESSIGVGAGS